MTAPTCPYCGNKAKLISSLEIYSSGIDYGLMYACLPCDARIGIRPETAHMTEPEPAGLMANAELRLAKRKAHIAFDKLWRSGLMSRTATYKWLAIALEIAPRDCHIAMFDLDYCEITEYLSRQQYTELSKIEE